MTQTLYAGLGGYDAICAVANDLLPRFKQIRDWLASGNTEARMASSGKNSS